MEYFPSITSGYQKFHFINNDKLLNGNSCRYWEYLDFKNLLISAGHNLELNSFRKEIGSEKAIVMADSGGYQLISGSISLNNYLSNLPEIFIWLENNSDIAINLDVSPNIKGITFAESLKLSYNNFKYFADHQTGKTKFYNVLQGRTISELKQWYNKVKVFEFDGWAIGGLQEATENYIIDVFDIIVEMNCKNIHFLGIFNSNIIKLLEYVEQKYNYNFSYDNSLLSRIAEYEFKTNKNYSKLWCDYFVEKLL